jgi:hypothetical protein
MSTGIVQGQTAIQKPKFSTVNEVGLLTGEKGEAMMLQTINGLRKNRSFAGLGVGLDFYGNRTIPLFLDYRYELSTHKNIPFIYANAGINFLWLNFIQKEQLNFPSPSPGLYYDLGLGLKLPGKNHGGFILTAGYSLKQVKYATRSFSIAPTPQLDADNKDRYTFLFRRLAIKIGLQL